VTRKGLGDKRNRHDPVYLRAKQENFAGRAIYKLEEIDQRFRLIKPGMKILDLGCWPGSWLQYAVAKAGPEAVLVGVDLEPVELSLPSNVHTYVGDVYKLKPDRLVARFGQFDLVLSDMAPNTTGNKDYDLPASEDLWLRALELATGVLRVGGHFCGKVFQGPRFGELRKQLAASFQEARAYRCETSRKTSREQYLIGRGLRASARARETPETSDPSCLPGGSGK
jgi:23S rRNA (uridine2552-2'-O)-methyltransferase